MKELLKTLYWNLYTPCVKVTCDSEYIPNQSILEPLSSIKHVYDEACFIAVLQAFLLGCTNREADDAILVDLVSEVCSHLEESRGKEQLELLARTASTIFRTLD